MSYDYLPPIQNRKAIVIFDRLYLALIVVQIKQQLTFSQNIWRLICSLQIRDLHAQLSDPSKTVTASVKF